MKQFSLLLLFTLCISFARATEVPATSNATFTKLMSVNQQWSKQPECGAILSQVNIPANATFTDLIALHLQWAETILRARDMSALSAGQRTNRLQLLDELHGYWNAGSFPVNNYVNYKAPVFIDRYGTHCAVGYLMQQSGADYLAQTINSQQKLAFVYDIKVEGVKAWADDHGFTVDELAWIQPNYTPSTPTDDMDGGVDGNVKVIVTDLSSSVAYIGGDFTKTTNGADCHYIAKWANASGTGGQWEAVGTGTNGAVLSLLVNGSLLIAGGDFTLAGGNYVSNIAAYNLYTSQWQALGSLDGAVRALALYNGSVYAGGDFTGHVARWDGTTWQTLGVTLTGNVRTLEVWNNQLVIGGSFASGYLKNAIAYDGTQVQPLGAGTLTPVNDFEVFNGDLYAGCDHVSGTDSCAIAKFESGNWVTKLKGGMTSSFSGFMYLNSIQQLKSNGNSLYAAGDFWAVNGMIDGKNLVEIDAAFTTCIPMLSTDSVIYALDIIAGKAYFGGCFMNNYAWPYANQLNRVGSFAVVNTPVQDVAPNLALSVYPNPAVNTIRVSLSDNHDLQTVRVYNALSQLVYTSGISSGARELSIPLAGLASGLYSVVVSSANNKYSEKLMVQR